MKSLLYTSFFIFTVKLFPSPAYALPTILLFIIFTFHRKLSLNYKCLIFTTISIPLILFTSLESLKHPAFILTISSLICLPIIKTDYILNVIKENLPSSYKFIILYYSLEGLIRITYPNLFSNNPESVAYYLQESNDSMFYAFKFGSFAFIDSNLVAICLLIALSLGIQLNFKKLISQKYLFLNILLILLTFSRAAYIGLGLILIISYQWKHILIYALLSIPLGIYFLFNFNDASLETKFKIYNDALSIININSFESLLIGKGFGWYLEEFGRASHSLIVQALIEGGLIYTIIFLITNYFYGAFSSAKSTALFFAILIPSLSVSIYVFFPGWLLTILINNILIKDRHEATSA